MREQGYSLVEMMVVVGLIGAMTAIAMPALFSFRDRLTLQGDALRLRSTLHMLQGEAMAYQLDRAVTVDVAAGTYSFRPRIDDDAVEERLSPGVAFSSPPETTYSLKDGRVVINYQASGWGTAGTLVLRSAAGETKKLIVQVGSGRVVLR